MLVKMVINLLVCANQVCHFALAFNSQGALSLIKYVHAVQVEENQLQTESKEPETLPHNWV